MGEKKDWQREKTCQSSQIRKVRYTRKESQSRTAMKEHPERGRKITTRRDRETRKRRAQEKKTGITSQTERDLETQEALEQENTD